MAAAKPPPGGEHIPDLSLPPAAGPRPKSATRKPGSPGPRKPVLGEEDIDWMDDFGPATALPAVRASARKPAGRPPLVSADFDWIDDDGGAGSGGGAVIVEGPLDTDWLDTGSVGGPSGSAKPVGVSYSGGGGFDFEDFDEDFDDVATDGGRLDVAAAIAADQPRRDLPTGITPTPEDLEITEAEVATVSGYGSRPAGWYLAPSYAVRVFQRRRVLTTRLVGLRQQLEQVETERDRALADLAANWRPRLLTDDRFKSLFQKVDDAESRLRVETEGMAEVNSQYREQVGRIETQRDQLERQRSGLLDVESELETELGARQVEHQRLAAQLKRIQIVLRNAAKLEAESKDPSTGVKLPPDHAAKVAHAQQQLPLAKQVEEAQLAHVKEADARVRAARANTQVVNKDLRQLDAQRRQLDKQFTQESSTRSELVADGERQRQTAWADVTRALLTTDLGRGLSDEEVSELKAHEAKVRRVATEFHRHALAVDAFDRDSYKTGIALMATVAGALVLMLVLAVGLRACGGAGASSAPSSPTKPADTRQDDGSFNASEEEWEESK